MGRTKDLQIEQREHEEATDSLIPNITLNKPSLNAQIQSIVQEVKKGRVNPLEAFIYLNWMLKVADGAKKRLLDEAIGEAEKYPEKDISLYDAKVTVKNGAGRYTYPDSIKKAQEASKMAYKAYKEGRTIVDDNGEIIEPAKYTPGKQILTITFP